MDQTLDELREEIESIDCGLLRLWERRMYAAMKLGAYKRDHGIGIFDAARESQLWTIWQQQLDEDNADLAALVFQANTAAAKLRQSQICRVSRPNIYLIGMPACGKAESGRKAAERLGHGFSDTDKLICEMYGCGIDRMLADGGEDLFRSRETAVLAALAAQPGGLIVATGDGIVSSSVNISLMRASGAMIYIDREPAAEALADIKIPWCRDLDDWRKLRLQRDALYRQAAAATVTGAGIDEVADRIIELLD